MLLPDVFEKQISLAFLLYSSYLQDHFHSRFESTLLQLTLTYTISSYSSKSSARQTPFTYDQIPLALSQMTPFPTSI